MTETAQDDAAEVRVRQWLERELHGNVLSIVRQDRWRPAWFAEVDVAGERHAIYVRGHRGGRYRDLTTLAQEADILRILGANDVPVPRIYGMIEHPQAIVMSRLPGRVNLATADSDAARDSILDQYIEAMRRMHDIDVAAFATIGLPVPSGKSDIALIMYQRAYDSYRLAKTAPNPMIEFMWRWLQRNYPRDRERRALIQADSAQFCFDGSRLTGLIDFEAAYVGDPCAEFAAMRIRDCEERLGDVASLARKYEAATGDRITKDAVEFHTAGWALVTPMQWEDAVRNPAPGDSWLEYFIWYVGVGRWGLEAIAEVLGTSLPVIEEPQSSPSSPFTRAVYPHLLSVLDEWPRGNDYDNFRAASARSVATFASRLHQYGPGLEQQDIDEISTILGRRQLDLPTAEAALEEFVLSADPDQDPALTQYFHLWTQRQQFLVRGIGARHERLIHIAPQPIPQM